MSNALAIASVTAGLAQIIQGAVQTTVPGAGVVIGRPDANATPAQRVHLYLYQVSPNSALRNGDLPTRNAEGKLMQRPRVALDLHYLLAFYGEENALEPQRMLGAVVRDLHCQPVLTSQNIADGISSYDLAGSNLAQSIEQIKFTPALLSLEELSKIWYVFLQTPHALSVAYLASVVLIEPDEGAPAALPVVRRGREDRGVDSFVGPSPFPVLEEIHIIEPEYAALRPRLRSYPNAQLGMQLTLLGRNLIGDMVMIRFRHPRLAEPIELQPVTQTADELTLVLPATDASEANQWIAGLYTVDVVVTKIIKAADGDRKEVRTTRTQRLKFAPRIMAMEVSTALGPVLNGRQTVNATLRVTCAPLLLDGQPVALLLADRKVPVSEQPNLAECNFIVEDAPTDTPMPIRLEVDGVESMPYHYLKTDSNGTLPTPQLNYDQDQRLTIPGATP